MRERCRSAKKCISTLFGWQIIFVSTKIPSIDARRKSSDSDVLKLPPDRVGQHIADEVRAGYRGIESWKLVYGGVGRRG